MSGFEEETYSTIFTSLNHSVRRKILKMLSEKPRSFSDMFESLGISSSHFNYHLENLGELVSKTEDGKYRLSFLGEAAIETMSKVEESPKSAPTKHSSAFIFKNWKPILLVLIIGVAFLASTNYIQLTSMTKISDENQILQDSNDLLWDFYSASLVSSAYPPPISKSEAIQKALQYGNWNAETIQGMVVDANVVYFRFETKSLQVSLLNEEILVEIPIARMFEVTQQVSDYKPVYDEDSIFRYVWEISVRKVQDHLDNNFSSSPSGIYHVDSFNGDIYPNLYALIYIDVDN